VTEQPADPARAMAVPPAPQVPPGRLAPPAGPAPAPPLAAAVPAASPARAPSPAPAAAPATRGRRGTARRSTGRPARTAPARARWWVQLPYWISLALVLAGLAWIWYGGSHRVRAGTLTMAGAMFAAAFARLVLPQPRGALLVSRRRLVDVVVLAALAVGLLVTGLVLPGPL
jgi:hypothetical protein